MSALYGPENAPFSYIRVSDEDFKAFHTIDRVLYTRLLLIQGRDQVESMLIMGLWILLEREGIVHDLVYDMLQCPNILIRSLADEAVMILRCIESEQFDVFSGTEIPFTSGMSSNGINLRFFFDNRIAILAGVTKIVNKVCTRAFDDISNQISIYNNLVNQGLANFGPTMPALDFRTGPMNMMAATSETVLLPGLFFANDGDDNVVDDAPTLQAAENARELAIGDHGDSSSSSSASSGLTSKNIIKNVLESKEMKEVPDDDNDKTIFLTFSKGYPISENKVRDFFTKLYGGDCVEAIHMQQVEEGEQPLYARLIVKSKLTMEGILKNKGKAKFNINGKHVWARKYVRKQS